MNSPILSRGTSMPALLSLAYALVDRQQHTRAGRAAPPPMSHLLGTADKVHTLLGSEKAVAAALLHHALEHDDGLLPQLSNQFPSPIPGIVADLTVPRRATNGLAPHQHQAARFAAYLAQLADTGHPDVLLIAACDLRDVLDGFHPRPIDGMDQGPSPAQLGFYGAAHAVIAQHDLCLGPIQTAADLLLETHARACRCLSITPADADKAFQQTVRPAS